jgi:hypothetical protein
LCLPRQSAGAFQVSGRNGGLRLLHKLPSLIDHVLFIGAELASSYLLEVRFRGPQHLVGSVSFVGRLAGRASGQLNARF